MVGEQCFGWRGQIVVFVGRTVVVAGIRGFS